jgi:hypothetical protein
LIAVSRTPFPHRPAPSPGRSQAGSIGKTVEIRRLRAESSFHSDLSSLYDRIAAKREGYCDRCNSVTGWLVATDYLGVPTDRVLAKLEPFFGPKAEAWAKAWAKAFTKEQGVTPAAAAVEA